LRFFDSSAVVKLYVEEQHSRRVRGWMEPVLSVVSRLTEIEVASAFGRSVRAGILSSEEGERALASLRADVARWQVVELTGEVVTEAVRLLSRHPLRAADAIQLGSALVFTQAMGQDLDGFVAFDQRLEDAARAERLAVPTF
jgi:predicted nucleic acid-binding protein